MERIQFSLNESAWVNDNMLFFLIYMLRRVIFPSPFLCYRIILSHWLQLFLPLTFSFYFFVNIFLVNIFRLFFGLKSSAKEPRQKEAYHGDEFTCDENSHHHLRQSIMVVLQTMASSTAPVIESHSSLSRLSRNRGVTCITTLRIGGFRMTSPKFKLHNY